MDYSEFDFTDIRGGQKLVLCANGNKRYIVLSSDAEEIPIISRHMGKDEALSFFLKMVEIMGKYEYSFEQRSKMILEA